MDNIKLEELAQTEQNTYMKKWRAKNRDKVKTYNTNYWKKRALKELQKTKEIKTALYT